MSYVKYLSSAICPAEKTVSRRSTCWNNTTKMRRKATTKLCRRWKPKNKLWGRNCLTYNFKNDQVLCLSIWHILYQVNFKRRWHIILIIKVSRSMHSDLQTSPKGKSLKQKSLLKRIERLCFLILRANAWHLLSFLPALTSLKIEKFLRISLIGSGSKVDFLFFGLHFVSFSKYSE